MNLKTILLISTFTISSFFLNAQEYPLNEKGKTTKQGIERYVSDKDSIVNAEFNKQFNTKSPRINFVTDDLTKYNDYSGEKGIYLGLDGFGEAIIDNTSSFENYSVKLLSRKRKDKFIYNTDFVKGTMFHEKAHAYWKFVEKNCKRKGIKLYVPKRNETDFQFRISFLEEGFSEYCAWKSGEIIAPEEYSFPKSFRDSISNKSWEVEYKYSMYFLKNFLDVFPLHFAIEVMLENAPPTEEEMINPIEYYKRLKHHELKFHFQNYSPKPQDFKSK
ncbi:MAG TPA: hypothetical protein VJ895_00370 [Candidatus Nanoarchaeia archaeon]|nr:hypothetical protein [Candidatus Nanoarchaeia archaeon]